MDIYFKKQLEPEGYARELLHQLKIPPVPPICPFSICEQLGIKIAWEPLDGVEALLIKNPKHNNAYIILQEGQAYQKRELFTVSHELGHFFIPSHLSALYKCSSNDIFNFRSNNSEEEEANRFAAELLMPSNWLKEKLKKSEASLDFIKAISTECETSLTSTAFRVAEMCPDPIAVVYSENSHVKWFKKSRSFPHFIRRGPLHPHSYAIDFFNGSSIPDKPKEVLASAWVTTSDDPNELLLEESVPMPNLNAVLTVITVPFTEEEDENHHEDYWV